MCRVLHEGHTPRQQQPATEMEKVLAMRRFSDLKKQTDKNYPARLRQQLASAENAEQ